MAANICAIKQFIHYNQYPFVPVITAQVNYIVYYNIYLGLLVKCQNNIKTVLWTAIMKSKMLCHLFHTSSSLLATGGKTLIMSVEIWSLLVEVVVEDTYSEGTLVFLLSECNVTFPLWCCFFASIWMCWMNTEAVCSGQVVSQWLSAMPQGLQLDVQCTVQPL